MAYSTRSYVGDGATATFGTPPYISKSHISVTINGVLQPFTWDSPTVIRLSTPPPNGVEIIVARSSNPSSALAVFADGALMASDLNLSVQQALYLLQETLDLARGPYTIPQILNAAMGIHAFNSALLNGTLPQNGIAMFEVGEEIADHAHYAFVDASVVNYASNAVPPLLQAHASFEASAQITGPNDSDHHHSYQDDSSFTGGGTLTTMRGFYTLPTIAGIGPGVGAWMGYYAGCPRGAGQVQNIYQFYAEANSSGRAYNVNFAFYSAGNAPSQFGGNISAGVNVTGNRGVFLGDPALACSITYNPNGNINITPRSSYHVNITRGKLGIGSESPLTALHLEGGNAALSGITLNNTSGPNEWQILPANNGINNLGLCLYDVTNSAARIQIDNAGNVGIGTQAPKSKLHVPGLPVYANNTAAVAGGLTAGAFYRTGADPDPVCVVH